MSDIELTAEAFAQLKKENSKLKLEANLRRSLSTQLEKQKKSLMRRSRKHKKKLQNLRFFPLNCQDTSHLKSMSKYSQAIKMQMSQVRGKNLRCFFLT